MKTCKDCGETKPLSEFRYSSTRKRYPNAAPEKHLQSYCKPCTSVRRDRWRKNNPERYRAGVRSYHVRSRYGLTEEEAERLDSITECEICGGTNRLGIDHCHDTNIVRGILCNSCNLSLGWANDNIEVLEKMIDYLRRSK